MPLTHEDRVRHGRIGGLIAHSRHNSADLTANARAAFRDSFKLQVDPDEMLSEAERARRADRAYKAYFARLALASAKARRARSEAETP
jgi:hypothetical protein